MPASETAEMKALLDAATEMARAALMPFLGMPYASILPVPPGAISVKRQKLPRKMKKRYKKQGILAVRVVFQPPPLKYITTTIGFTSGK
jgi:hypothetical protein